MYTSNRYIYIYSVIEFATLILSRNFLGNFELIFLAASKYQQFQKNTILFHFIKFTLREFFFGFSAAKVYSVEN